MRNAYLIIGHRSITIIFHLYLWPRPMCHFALSCSLLFNLLFTNLLPCRIGQFGISLHILKFLFTLSSQSYQNVGFSICSLINSLISSQNSMLFSFLTWLSGQELVLLIIFNKSFKLQCYSKLVLWPFWLILLIFMIFLYHI